MSFHQRSRRLSRSFVGPTLFWASQGPKQWDIWSPMRWWLSVGPPAWPPVSAGLILLHGRGHSGLCSPFLWHVHRKKQGKTSVGWACQNFSPDSSLLTAGPDIPRGKVNITYNLLCNAKCTFDRLSSSMIASEEHSQATQVRHCTSCLWFQIQAIN